MRARSSGRASAERARAGVHHAARRASPGIEALGRAGYAALGVVYALVGVLAVRAAAGAGGATTDTHGALGQIIAAPFGRVLLALVALGLVGYALWRFVQATLDTEGKGTGPGGLAGRVGFVVTGVVYLGLAASAARLVANRGGGGNGDATAQDWTARFMAAPFGRWLVGFAGVVVVGLGLFQFYRAYRADFRDVLRRDALGGTVERVVVTLGRAGYAARGVAFVVIGVLLVVAARQDRPQDARGLGGALATLAAQPFGPWLLGVVAAGLFAYGLFLLALARYRRIVIS